ncbi:hypothetical protein C8034_v007777 [Colletotrichum sidae]|uniref:Histidine kinase group protein n=1 Tax=Colletotrichum sidae TaxID=1347389 RepID=A0A4V3I427_9PEZI|nr:hypothetical protein C8034_v007777 [Colletotrichum sidae]
MAKKKNKQAASDDVDGGVPSGSASQASSSGDSSKNRKAGSAPSETAPMLIICRNKHWRYISSFHGPWLQMPIEILETLANINYNTPPPRPIDPAVFFDLLKIRRLVDEATNLAVRAASDVASPTMSNLNGRYGGSWASLGITGGAHGTKLSKERKFRMREQASQKLARAYRLDEIACSVATMQGASSLDEIGSLVLHRNRDDPDAKYVHFFHEKIPSRQLAECTSLQPLTDIVDARPTESEALRTRATVRIFKEDCEGAARDLTLALQRHRFHQPLHRPPSSQDLQLASGSRRGNVILTEEQHPSSLEAQLLFQRAGVYLTIACQLVVDALPNASANGTTRANGASGNGSSEDQTPLGQAGEPTPAEKEAARARMEARQKVKLNAKRALKDYMAYFSQFQYTPDLPWQVAKDFTEKVNMAAHYVRHPRVPDSGVMAAHKTYQVSDLFAAVPPADIPPYPSQEIVRQSGPPPVQPSNHEAVTYHPLMTDALHSLLLCHCLVQTSTKELLRHAHMVARLARLADGYPIFQSSRSPARADWLEVLRRADNWIQMSSSWEQLCAPAPLPVFDGSGAEISGKTQASPKAAALAAAAIVKDSHSLPDTGETEDERKERIRQQAIVDSLNDDRVVDEVTMRAAVTARQERAEHDHEQVSGLKKGANGKANDAPQDQSLPALRRWSVDDSREKEYPILTERAASIARWVLEAPTVGTAKRKKKPSSKKDREASGPESATSSMATLAVSETGRTVDTQA